MSEIRVSKIRISSNHRELHGAIFLHHTQHKLQQNIQHPATSPSKNVLSHKNVSNEKEVATEFKQISSQNTRQYPTKVRIVMITKEANGLRRRMKSVVSNQPPVTFQADREHDNSHFGWTEPCMHKIVWHYTSFSGMKHLWYENDRKRLFTQTGTVSEGFGRSDQMWHFTSFPSKL